MRENCSKQMSIYFQAMKIAISNPDFCSSASQPLLSLVDLQQLFKIRTFLNTASYIGCTWNLINADHCSTRRLTSPNQFILKRNRVVEPNGKLHQVHVE